MFGTLSPGTPTRTTSRTTPRAGRTGSRTGTNSPASPPPGPLDPVSGGSRPSPGPLQAMLRPGRPPPGCGGGRRRGARCRSAVRPTGGEAHHGHPPVSPRGGTACGAPRDAMSDVEAHREQLPTRAVDRPDVPRTARRVDRPDPQRCTSTSRPPLPGAARRSRRCTSTSRPRPARRRAPVLHGVPRLADVTLHGAPGHQLEHRRPTSRAAPIRAPGLPGGARGDGPRSGPRLGPGGPSRPPPAGGLPARPRRPGRGPGPPQVVRLGR